MPSQLRPWMTFLTGQNRSKSNRRAARNYQPGLIDARLESRQLLAVTIAEIAVPAPNNIVSGPDGNIWTYHGDQKGDTITRIDKLTGQTKTFPTPYSYGITQNLFSSGPDGKIWFGSPNSAKISKLDPATGLVTNYPLPNSLTDYGGFATALTAGPDGDEWFAWRSVDFFNNASSDGIGKIDPSTGTFTTFIISEGTIRSGGIHSNLDLGSDHNFYVGSATNTFTKIAPDGTSKQVQVPGLSSFGTILMGPDSKLYVLDPLHNSVASLDPTTFQILKNYNLPSGDGNQAPNMSMAFAADGTLWVTEDIANKMAQIDTVKQTVTEFAMPHTSDNPPILVGPLKIVKGSDGNLWYTENNLPEVGVLELSGHGPTAGFQTTFGGTLPAINLGGGTGSIAPTVTSVTLAYQTHVTGPKKHPRVTKTFSGFTVTFSTAVDLTSFITDSFTVFANVKKGKKMTIKYLPYNSELDLSGTVGTIILSGKPNKFAFGGTLIVPTTIMSVTGTPLAQTYTFTISAGAKSIHS